jgi:multidrug efflux pump subunit AcrA (membrane-fusion protein)
MKRRLRIVGLVVGLIVIVAAGGGWWYFSTHPADWQRIVGQLPLPDSEDGTLVASGFIEAEEIDLAPELGGRLTALFVEEGDDVAAGETVLRFDETLIQAQIEAAQAEVDVARAELAQVEAGARPARIRQAEAALRQAEAAREGAHQAWQDAMALRDNPQELDARIAQARAEVAAAKAAVTRAHALKEAAALAKDNFDDAQEAIDEALERWKEIPEPQRPPRPQIDTQLSFHLLPNQYWQAWVNLNTATARLEGAQRRLRDLNEMREDPQDLNAQVIAAQGRYEVAQAGVERARANLAGLREGATATQLATLEAQVSQAQARLQTLIRQREKLTITAPVGGLVLDLAIHEGELTAPGSTLLTLGTLDEVDLTVYVPEARLGEVAVGQTVAVRVDSFPERTFEGEVVAIASEHEFTPRNVQTKEERVHMVFGVHIRVPNPDHALKPGVPADAVFTERPSRGEGE